jgi:hypothetical protein
LKIERKFKAAQSAITTNPSHSAIDIALQGKLDAIQLDLADIKADVKAAKGHLLDGVARFDAWRQRQPTKRERANFTEATKRLAIEYLLTGFDGRCPINDRLIADPNGKTYEIDFHHIDGNPSNPKPENCCPLSDEGHTDYHKDSANPAYKAAIDSWQVAFQKFLKRKENPLGL